MIATGNHLDLLRCALPQPPGEGLPTAQINYNLSVQLWSSEPKGCCFTNRVRDALVAGPCPLNYNLFQKKVLDILAGVC